MRNPRRKAAGQEAAIRLPDDEEARRYITAHLGKMTAEDICALFLVRLDQAAEMTETYGQEEKEHMMACVGKILSSMFRGSDIVSRVGEDSFLVYSAGAIIREEGAGEGERGLLAGAPCRGGALRYDGNSLRRGIPGAGSADPV